MFYVYAHPRTCLRLLTLIHYCMKTHYEQLSFHTQQNPKFYNPTLCTFLLQGVIFSIFYHNGLQRICSVSDDRSIILYQLCFPAAATKTGGASDGVVDWASVTISPMLTLFGHSARVWDVVLLADQFVSVGEVSWDFFVILSSSNS